MKISLSRHAIAKNKETRREGLIRMSWYLTSITSPSPSIGTYAIIYERLSDRRECRNKVGLIRIRMRFIGLTRMRNEVRRAHQNVVGLVRWGCLHRHRLDSYVQYANRYEGNYLMKARPSPGCREKMEQMTHTFMQQWLQYVYCRRCSVSLLPASTYQWIIMRYGMLYRIVLYGREKECNWCSIYCAQCKVF